MSLKDSGGSALGSSRGTAAARSAASVGGFTPSGGISRGNYRAALDTIRAQRGDTSALKQSVRVGKNTGVSMKDINSWLSNVANKRSSAGTRMSSIHTDVMYGHDEATIANSAYNKLPKGSVR